MDAFRLAVLEAAPFAIRWRALSFEAQSNACLSEAYPRDTEDISFSILMALTLMHHTWNVPLTGPGEL